MLNVDELDWQVIDALRVNPRASWTLVGRVLGVDAVTVARRWERMVGDGLAWVFAYPGPLGFPSMTLALVEVICEVGATGRVTAAVVEHPYAVTVEQTAGGRDFVILAIAPTLRALAGYLAEDLETVRGVRRARSSIVTRMESDGSTWRGGTLSPDQQRRLRPPRPTGGTEPLIPQPLDYRIMTALSEDGRMTLNNLAAHCQVSPSTIRRRLPVLIDNGAVVFRTDLTRPLSHRPTAALFFAEVSSGQLHEISHRVAKLPGVRASWCVAGPCNLVIEAWVNSPAAVRDFEVLLDRQNLALTVRDRSVVLRNVKHVGRILDDDGRVLRTLHYPYEPDYQT